MINVSVFEEVRKDLIEREVTLVAVSKTKPVADLQDLYDLGQRHFGENYVQELLDKEAVLPKDIQWHFIGHLQSNKVKFIAPFVHLIHGVDSFKLLLEINKQAQKVNRVIDVLLQIHIATEETKFGLDERDVIEFMQFYNAQQAALQNVRMCGVMGMATDTADKAQVKTEFEHLFSIYRNLQQSDFFGKSYFNTCSMGMSGDYQMAVDAGSTMVRIGSLLFGKR